MEPAAIARFTISVDAAGPFTPGSVVRLHARVRANLSTGKAQLRIAVPEIEAARIHDFKTLGRVAGFHVPALRSAERSLAAGQEVAFTEAVTVPASGYFRAVVSAVAAPGEALTLNGRPVQNTAHEEVWFFVSPQRGRATAAFDPSILPDSLIPMPGLARVKPSYRKSQPRNGSATLTAGVQTLALLSPGVRQMTYYNPDTYTYDPIPDLAVRWQEWDPYQGTPAGGGTVSTDQNGEFTEPCPSDNGGSYDNSIDGTISTDYFAQVYWGNSTAISGWNAGSPWSCNEQSEPWIVANGKQARVYLNANRTVFASQAAFGHSIISPDIRISTGATGSSYSTSTHRITLDTAQIWGEWGRFTVAHEFGHEVHDLSLGGIFAQSGSCSVHYLDQPSNLGCAWQEGVADFHAAIVEGTSNVYTAPFYSNGYFASGPYADGSVVEGAVAAFMVDALGSVSMTTQQMAGTIRTCKLVHGLLTTPPSGADDLVYCLERTIDSGVQSTYFTGRSAPKASSITALGPLPSGWSQATIRALWLHDLYKM